MDVMSVSAARSMSHQSFAFVVSRTEDRTHRGLGGAELTNR